MSRLILALILPLAFAMSCASSANQSQNSSVDERDRLAGPSGGATSENPDGTSSNAHIAGTAAGHDMADRAPSSREMDLGGLPMINEERSRGLNHPIPGLKNPRVFTVSDPQTLAIQPSVSFGKDGRLGVAWCGMTDNNLGIYFALYGTDEMPTQAPFVVNTEEIGIQNEPTICSLQTGGFVIAWSQDSQGRAPNLGMRFRRFDSNGQPLDAADRIVTTGQPSNHWLTHLACDPRNGFAITGVFGESNSTFGVFVQRYGADGRPTDGPVVLNPDPAGTQIYPAVAINSVGDSIVSWEDTMDDGTPSRIFVTTVSDEEEQANQVIINASPLDVEAKSPALIALNDDGDVLISMTLDQRRIGLFRVDKMGQTYTLAGPEEQPAYHGVLARGASDEAILMYLTGSGTNMAVRLIRVDGRTGREQMVALPTERVAPYQPSVANFRGRLAAAWTERTEEMGFRIRIAIYGADAPVSID